MSIRELVTTIGASALASRAGAAQSTEQVTCCGSTFTIRTNSTNSSQQGRWSAAQLLDAKGHAMPVSFNGSACDTTIDQKHMSFQLVKGSENAKQNQTPCTTTYSGIYEGLSGGAPITDRAISPFDQVVMTGLPASSSSRDCGR